MDYALHILEGPDRERTLEPVAGQAFVYGRAGTPDRNLALPTDARVGRRHLVIEEVGGRLVARVAEPKYQVWVDGRGVTSAELRDGSLVALGDTRLRVAIPDARGGGGMPPPVVVPRRALSEFDLGAEIGAGGQGRVVAATDRATGRPVAVKLLKENLLEDDEIVQHFLREMDMLCRVQHENVVKAVAVGRDAGQFFLAMERLPGQDLETLVKSGWTLDPLECVAVGTGILRALAHAHGLGVVHRDVKPHNVVVHRPDRGALRVWLLDFGLAKPMREGHGLAAPSLTQTGQAKGTFQFAAPECLLDVKRAGPAADLFSAAATLYWALTGRLYFDEEKYADGFFQAVLSADVMPLLARRPALPADLAQFVEAGLKAKPADRWPSAVEALVRLSALPMTRTHG